MSKYTDSHLDELTRRFVKSAPSRSSPVEQEEEKEFDKAPSAPESGKSPIGWFLAGGLGLAGIAGMILLLLLRR